MAIFNFDYYSQARKGFVSINAILPLDPPTLEVGAPIVYTHGPYKTIYLLHGYSGNRNDWLVRTNIELWAMQNGYAVIMPDGANYFYVDNEETEEYYGSFIGEELIDITRQIFPLSQRREDTIIAGLSMGGYGALRNGLKYSETFGSIIALSSALIVDEIKTMTAGERNEVSTYAFYRHTFGDLEGLPGSDCDPKHLAELRVNDTNRPRIFMACGSEDFLYPNNIELHEYLDSIGYPHEWWVQYGIHDFEFWNRAMPAAIQWLSKE